MLSTFHRRTALHNQRFKFLPLYHGSLVFFEPLRNLKFLESISGTLRIETKISSKGQQIMDLKGIFILDLTCAHTTWDLTSRIDYDSKLGQEYLPRSSEEWYRIFISPWCPGQGLNIKFPFWEAFKQIGERFSKINLAMDLIGWVNINPWFENYCSDLCFWTGQHPLI